MLSKRWTKRSAMLSRRSKRPHRSIIQESKIMLQSKQATSLFLILPPSVFS
jgi:hypothetical protein